MDVINFSIRHPIIVSALLLMLVLGGVVAIVNIPVQLTPDVRKQVITIKTFWNGASPAEIEREIITPQENELKDLPGLERMESTSSLNYGEIELILSLDADPESTLLQVANRLDQVRDYPDEAGRPSLDTAGSEDKPMAWALLKRLPGNDTPIHHYGKFGEDYIRSRIERIEGVARVNVFGGTDPEMRIIFKPFELAAQKLFIPQVIKILRDNDFATTSGDIDEGKRRYIIRVDGDFKSIERVKDVVIRTRIDEDGAVEKLRLRDVAEVVFAYKDKKAEIRGSGEPALALNMIRTTGSNVIAVMADIQAAIAELNEGILAEEGVYLLQVYDETVYIKSAIKLVRQNIILGAILAMGILLLFLRSATAMIVIGCAIPLSVLGAFVSMSFLGRSFNVISFAGIAFAVGMVVDAALVVLENTFRLREKGEKPERAALLGARQVWMAVLVSTLTTVIVFLPLLLLKLEAGQLFRDIAVAISAAVLFSLMIALTVVPMLAAKLTRGAKSKVPAMPAQLAWLERFAKNFADKLINFASRASSSMRRALIVSGSVSLGALLFTVLFLPKLEYLPEGNSNLIFGYILPPPGYNLKTTDEIADRVEAVARPLLYDPQNPQEEVDGIPSVRHFFFVTRPTSTFLGASSVNSKRVAELIPVFTPSAFSEPGTFGFINQLSLFGRGVSGGRAIDLDIFGEDLEQIIPVAREVARRVLEVFPFQGGNQLRPIPGLELGSPELRLFPRQDALSDVGMTAKDFGDSLRALTGGIRVNEITVGGEQMDLTLRAEENSFTSTQAVAYAPITLPNGDTLPALALASAEHTSGPLEIRRLERERTVTIELRPARRIPLEAAMEMLDKQVTAPMMAEGLPRGVTMRVSGYADELTKTWNALSGNLMLSIAVVYLIMVILFESFLYPLVIMLSVPVAMAGGVLGLTVLNFWILQQLDMLTMLGFVILIGIVVNNAILIVHQALALYERGAAIKFSVMEAVRNRIRPIFMSTLTSFFGMLPLVLFPFEGSELYRGLGAVVLGGLALSSLLTLVIVPPVLSIAMQLAERAGSKRRAASKR